MTPANDSRWIGSLSPTLLLLLGCMKDMVAWGFAIGLAIRLVLFTAHGSIKLSRSIQVATPITSLVRLAEGFWLKKLGLSPYAGSVYHGSPLLLELLGPVAENSSVVFLVSDLATALVLLLIGRMLSRSREFFGDGVPKKFDAGELAAVLYLLNPFTVFSCVGSSTSPIENFVICLALYAAVAGNAVLAAFAWVMASHLSMYPVVLCIPIVLALSCGPDRPPSKVLKLKQVKNLNRSLDVRWSRVWSFLLWSAIWSCFVLALCSRVLRHSSGISEMLKETYGFILTVKDLTPNIGIFWYFFTEVFDFYRPFFLMLFHGNILCMIAPLSICFHHRPVFMAFVILAVISTLKSYPSLGDAALYLGLMGLFTHELSDFKYSFLLLNSYICVAMLAPVMFNLWIFRGTGNANFFFATALAYAFVQSVLIVESVSSLLRFDRRLKKSVQQSKVDGKED